MDQKQWRGPESWIRVSFHADPDAYPDPVSKMAFWKKLIFSTFIFFVQFWVTFRGTGPGSGSVIILREKNLNLNKIILISSFQPFCASEFFCCSKICHHMYGTGRESTVRVPCLSWTCFNEPSRILLEMKWADTVILNITKTVKLMVTTTLFVPL